LPSGKKENEGGKNCSIGSGSGPPTSHYIPSIAAAVAAGHLAAINGLQDLLRKIFRKIFCSFDSSKASFFLLPSIAERTLLLLGPLPGGVKY